MRMAVERVPTSSSRRFVSWADRREERVSGDARRADIALPITPG